MSDRQTFLIFDGHAVIYRAFYALPPLTDPQGRVVNAVYGFSRILLAALSEFSPDFVAVTFDHPKPTFRHQQYKEYKAQRPTMPDDLQSQIPIIKEVVSVLGIPQFELEGYEADDLIGTLSYWLDFHPDKLEAKGDILTIIVTGDKDLLQLVDQNTCVWIPGKGQGKDTKYDTHLVETKIGVKPEQIVELKALMGDASDNIPGVKGIGPKTAVTLINQYGTVERLYQAIDGLTQSKQSDSLLKGALLTKLIEGKKMALLSLDLAKIDRNAPLELHLQQCRVEGYDKTKAVEFFQSLEFNSLIKLLPADQFESDVQQALF
ncbi:MAG TPA: 5'-3' exonuclease H3TH domain-containing protein [Candidatus Woesebacteria bacterium]|nr:5'-3' exonuclease H3TH domain-containing protein [Candidatus Woesebacteria bacterium]